jgi:acetolactate synthase regulatory subunit
MQKGYDGRNDKVNRPAGTAPMPETTERLLRDTRRRQPFVQKIDGTASVAGAGAQ